MTKHLFPLVACCLCAFLTFSPEAAADLVLQVDGGRGSINVYYPDSYDPSDPLPLLIGLHGYSHWAQGFEDYAMFRQHVDSRRFIYLYPDGRVDAWGNRFWNATDYCCDFGGTNVNDSGYLQNLVAEVSAVLSVDDKRVWTVGHSNGGFMGYRLACDAPGTFAAIVSIAGATWINQANCPADQPVHVLQIHGSDDTVINYGGSAGYPSAEETVQRWTAIDHCDPTPDESLPNIDLDSGIPGNETSRMVWGNCNPSGAGELWSIWGGSHGPNFVSNFSSLVLDWLFAHPKSEMAVNFCTGAPNSASTTGAAISLIGYPSFSSSDLGLQAAGLPPLQFGIFFGGLQAQDPAFSLGNGYLCVSPQGLHRLLPPVPTDAGEAALALDLSVPPLDSYQIGDTRYFQFWYRDTMAGGSNFNLTDALAVTFYP
jgi:polyhydroxybutyrate depolymerase